MRNLKLTLIVFALLAAVAVVPAALAGTPTGAGPNDPMLVTGAWQTLAPGASAWFYYDYTADGSTAEVDLDTNHVAGFQVAIYTPALADAWLRDPSGTKPVGIGTPPGSQTASRDHDLVWRGAFHEGGRYFAVVTNQSQAQADYRILISGLSVVLAPTPTPTPYPTPLFNTPAPPVSVSGKFVFMEASGGNIYTVNGDGTGLKTLTVGIDPAWSPDGTQIAYARWDEPAGLYVMNADGSDSRSVFAWSKLLSPRWSPDGKMIAFSRQNGGNLDTVTRTFIRCFDIPFPPGVTPPDPHPQQCFGNTQSYEPNPWWKIGVVQVADQTLNEPKSTDHAFSPTWNMDGSAIAYADAGFGVQLTDLKQSAPAPLYDEVATVQSPAWSPDGSQIAFEVRAHDHWEISIMNADGSNVRAVTVANPFAWGPVNNVAPVWSPDGKQIVFLSDRNGKWEFFAINPDGTGIEQVLKGITDSMTIHYNFSNERVIDWSK